MIELIDYLIENGACDCCARCIHNKSISDSGNVEPCAEFGKDGNVACRNGMIEFFKQKNKGDI